MATASRRTCRGHDGMWQPKLHPSRSTSRWVMAFWIFSNMAAVRHFEFKKFIIWSRDCDYGPNLLLVPNFIKIGSRVRPPDAHNCRRYIASLLGNGRCHGDRIMADMSRTWWDVTIQLASQSVHWWASYGIWNIFQHGGRPPFWILKILIFNHVTVILVLTCCCVPNFIKVGSRVRPQDAHNCRMFNAPLLGNGRCHGNRIVRDMSGRRWDVTTQVGS